MTQDLCLTGVSLSNAVRKKGDDWFAECMSHVRALHQILSILYEGIDSDEVEEEINAIKGDSLMSTKFGTRQDGSTPTPSNLFSQHCYSLVQLFSEKTKGPVKFPLNSVMKVLTRCLKVSYTDVMALPSMSQLAADIPGLHQACMDVLGQLILCCKRDLLPVSRPLIDLCLQTLTSASKMNSNHKSRTKASVYQTLLLWVHTCGWGSFLNLHAKTLIQDLVSTTKITEDSMRISVTKLESAPDVVFGKKRKGKKKRINKGDSYAELSLVGDEQEVTVVSPDELEVCQLSLSFARTAVENLPFSSSQTLIRHITDTTAEVQKKMMDKCKPYHVTQVRTELYRALTACALASLDSSGHRNNAIYHFQLTNSALHLLIAADSMEVHEIKLVCSQALKNIQLYGNCKGPVIRKVLPTDNNDAEDIAELMREKDRLGDDVESLRARLLESEMNNEQQFRMIASLRKEISNLQMEKVQRRLVSTTHTDKFQSISGAEPRSSKSPISDADDNNIEDESLDDLDEISCIESVQEEKKQTVRNVPARSSTMSGVSDVEDYQSAYVNRDEVVNERVEGNSEQELPSSNYSKKRSNAAEDKVDESDVKRLKSDVQQGDTVQDMLLDFVDAPPDS